MATQITRGMADALIEPQIAREIIQGVTKQSAVLNMFRKLPNMTTRQLTLKVLDALPIAYWQTADTAHKNLTTQAWADKWIIAEELAVIVPIAENVLADADYDIWAEVRPRIVEAFGKKIDEAIILGVNKPKNFRTDLVTSIRNAGAIVTPGTNGLYSDINDAMTYVEESGFSPSGLVGGVNLKGKFRMMLDTTKQPITGTEIDSLPKAYIDNGSWDNSKAGFIVGDMTQAVYAIRQDITFKVLDQGVIQDPSTKEILYNLAQQDMVALRVVMRLGWEIPNPINALQPDHAVRFPFALVDAVPTPVTHNVTIQVRDNAGTPAPITGARVEFGGQVRSTPASGNVIFKVPANSSTLYRVMKDGFATIFGAVDVTNAAQTATVTLLPSGR